MVKHPDQAAKEAARNVFSWHEAADFRTATTRPRPISDMRLTGALGR
jgi:hypothetical protein